MTYSLRELEEWNKKIENKALELGLDFYPQEFEIIGFNEMIGYEAYLGIPSRYPHWSFGKAYEKNKTLYSLNLTGLPYEMVINSNPCLAYLMKENTLLLQILTMAHVYGHNDFFKNNRLFKEGTRASHSLEMFKLDGDNWSEDNENAVKAVKELCKVSNMFGYAELLPSTYSTTMYFKFTNEVKEKNFTPVIVREKKDLWSALKLMLTNEMREDVR